MFTAITPDGNKKKNYLPVITQGASYYSDIGESEYDSQICVSPTNPKQERIKLKATFVIKK
jgi:hypothetical protein